MGCPPILLLVAEIHPAHFVAMLLLYVIDEVSPYIWAWYTVANYIYKVQILPQTFAYIRSKTRGLAGSTGKHYRKPVLQILLYLAEYAPKVALHVFAAFELVTFFCRSGTLMYHPEMVCIPCPIHYPAGSQRHIRQSYEGSTAAAGFDFGRILMARTVTIGLRQVFRAVVIVIESTDLFTAPAVDTSFSIHHRVQESHCVRLHGDCVRQAYAFTRGTAAAIRRVGYLYWHCSIINYLQSNKLITIARIFSAHVFQLSLTLYNWFEREDIFSSSPVARQLFIFRAKSLPVASVGSR